MHFSQCLAQIKDPELFVEEFGANFEDKMASLSESANGKVVSVEVPLYQFTLEKEFRAERHFLYMINNMNIVGEFTKALKRSQV